MKIAAAHALADLARADVPDEVRRLWRAAEYGPDYIIPVPFDPRLISAVPPAVAKAAMDTGVARKLIADMDAYREALRSRRDPVAGVLQRVYERLRRSPKRVVFAEGAASALAVSDNFACWAVWVVCACTGKTDAGISSTVAAMASAASDVDGQKGQ